MSTWLHVEIFLQEPTGVGRYRSRMRHAGNKRYKFRYEYREASALPGTRGDGAITFTNEPDALIFQSHDQK
jgi:hypothetical protein